MKPMILAAGLVAAIGTAAAAVADRPATEASTPHSTQVVPIGDMGSARAAHQATLLGSGHVLVTGGCTGRCDASLRSTELYDPKARAFRPAAAMAVARDSHLALRLDDGRVLVAGGWSAGKVTASAEIYDPASGRFAGTGAMGVARAAPSATRLGDGRILVTGGQDSALEPLASAELFDPRTSRFSPVGSMGVPRAGHVAVALADGKVLIVGGRQARRGGILRTAELFDPSTGRFQPTGEMSVVRHKLAAARLPDGRVLVLGGADERDHGGRHSSTEIYDPRTGRFTPGAAMRWPRFKLADAVARLPGGAILVAGGASRFERYEPGSGRFATVPGEPDGPREFATASVLASGEVLVLGGYDEDIRTSASAWLVRAP